MVFLAVCSDFSEIARGSGTSQITANGAEYQLKSAFIYNFMKFVEWPDPNIAQPNATAELQTEPLVVGIVGQDPFGEALDAIAEKKIKNRPIHVVRIEGIEEFLKKNTGAGGMDSYRKARGQALQRCQVLFISRSEKNRTSELLSILGDQSILTISDNENFLQAGGMISLVMEGNKIRFDIHLGATEKKKLKISSQLLNLARYVEREKSASRK